MSFFSAFCKFFRQVAIKLTWFRLQFLAPLIPKVARILSREGKQETKGSMFKYDDSGNA